jgi:Uma2 family endonuclease
MTAEHAYVPGMSPLMTAEELLQTPFPNKRAELVKGRLIVREPPGGLHGSITATLTIRLGNHIDLTGAGRLFTGDTGFRLTREPDTVRAPDIAFIRRERLPSPIPDSYVELAPDLVVEILSPHDRPGETLAKVGDWIDAGTRMVWVVDPQRRVTRIYRHDGTESTISEADALNGEDVLPGFSCSLSSIL